MKLTAIKQLDEQQTYIPRKMGDPTARKMADQLVRNAIKNFHEKDELPAAKKMARGFYNNLLKHIDEIYHEKRMKEVTPAADETSDEQVQEKKLSLRG